MPGGRGLNRRRQGVEGAHDVVEIHGVALHNLHGLQLLKFGAGAYFVFAFVGVVDQVSGIRNVPNVAHLVAQELQVAEDQVEGQEGPNIAQVNVAVDGGSTDIQAYVSFLNRLESP